MIPIAKTADPKQVEFLRAKLEGQPCVVVGSAPLPTPTAEIAAGEFVIAVNGAISSLPGPADIWVLNSKQQDRPGDPLLKPLHKTMLHQGAGRFADHLLFLRGPKVASELYTRDHLERIGARWTSWSVLDKTTKRWLEGQECGRKREADPCSAGVLAATVALVNGAASVRLVGFSFVPGYHYLPKARTGSWWRDHIGADKRAIKVLAERYPGKLSGALLEVPA